MTVINETVLNCLRNGVCPADAKSWMLTEISKNPQAYEQALGGSLPENIYTELNIPNYKAYGNGFDKEYIDNMLADDKFQNVIGKTSRNEGGYVNDPKDRGKETKYGISKKWYPNEDIRNLTPQRAQAILYKDYWLKPKINQLPDVYQYPVFDNGVVQGPGASIKHIQSAAGAGVDGIIGSNTINALNSHSDSQRVLNRFQNNVQGRYDEIVENDSSQKRYRDGWRNRNNTY